MYRSVLFRFCFILLIFSQVACRTSQQAFHQGDYESAIRMCVDKLRSNPHHKKSVAIIKQAYPNFLQNAQNDIQRHKDSQREGKWVAIVQIYERVHDIHDRIQTCPRAWEVIGKPLRFDASLQEAKRNAAQAYYDEAIRLLSKNNFRDARSAYKYFGEAERYYPYITPDIKARLSEAKQKATIHIELCLLPLNQAFMQYDINANESNNALSLYASRLNKNEFMECDFVQIPQPESDMIDDRIALAYTRFLPEGVQYKEETAQREREIKKDSATEKIRATISLRQKSLKASCSLEIRIIEAETGKVLLNEAIQENYKWHTDWVVMLKGDTRALSDKESKQLGEREEPTPTNQQIFKALQKKIVEKVEAKINAHYR